jgi:iron complex outermembrane receptor protein
MALADETNWRRMSRRVFSLVLTIGWLPICAQSRRTSLPPGLENASIAELLNVEVTSVSRKQERLVATPASVFVINEDDIRRSGLNSIPALLVAGFNIPSDWRADARFAWRPSRSVELAIDGQNLSSAEHPEFFSYRLAGVGLIPRSVFGSVTWMR